MIEWQPIETAPKIDAILVTNGELCIVFHLYSGFYVPSGYTIKDKLPFCIEQITHWMPIPPPPK